MNVNDVWDPIFLEVDVEHLSLVSLVCKTWNGVATNPHFLKKYLYAKIAFKGEDWNQGSRNLISTEEMKKSFNFLDLNIFKFLKVKGIHKHSLIWIPENISINNFTELFQLTIYAFEPIIEHEGSRLLPGGWVIISHDIIEESRNKSYSEQEQLVLKLNDDQYKGWRVAKLAEMIVCMTAYYFKTGKILYTEAEWTYLRCLETVEEVYATIRCDVARSFHIHQYVYDYKFIAMTAIYEL